VNVLSSEHNLRTYASIHRSKKNRKASKRLSHAPKTGSKQDMLGGSRKRHHQSISGTQSKRHKSSSRQKEILARDALLYNKNQKALSKYQKYIPKKMIGEKVNTSGKKRDRKQSTRNTLISGSTFD